jgi:hypothetical protein
MNKNVGKYIKKFALYVCLIVSVYLWLVFNLSKSTGELELNVFRSEALLDFIIIGVVVIFLYVVYEESKK